MKNVIAVLSVLVIFNGIAIWCQTPVEATQTIQLTDPVIVYQAEEETEEPMKEVEFKSDYDAQVNMVWEAAERHGIDPKLAVAISRLETGNFKSESFRISKNFGGLTRNGKVVCYTKVSEAMEDYMACLEYHYITKGRTTPELMAPKYCPVNQENWCKSVKEIMSEYE